MRKRYYTDYVHHMIRFYDSCINHGETPNDINFVSCRNVFERHDGNVEKILREYSTSDYVDHDYVVLELSKTTNLPIKEIWALIRQTEREIAKERGLIYDTK